MSSSIETRVAVGSLNDDKLLAAKFVSGIVFMGSADVKCYDVLSNVSSQPVGIEEMWKGAINRAVNAMEVDGVEYGFGMESGVYSGGRERFFTSAATCIVGPNGVVGEGQTAGVALPDEVAKLVVVGGYEVRTALERVHDREVPDCIAVLTDNRMTASQFFMDGLLLAMTDYRQQANGPGR